MQCFSLVAERRIVIGPSSQFANSITFVVPELYPQSRKGIRVPVNYPFIRLDDKQQVHISPELMSSKDPDAVRQEGETILILRASLVRSGKDLTLVPETHHAEFGAIALLDPGRGSQSNLRFGFDEPEIVARGKRRVDLFTTEEVVLAVFPGFRPVACYRSDRRWLVFGKELVRETLLIRFNGQELSYQIPGSEAQDPLGR